jgi:hypothetical protein
MVSVMMHNDVYNIIAMNITDEHFLIYTLQGGMGKSK